MGCKFILMLGILFIKAHVAALIKHPRLIDSDKKLETSLLHSDTRLGISGTLFTINNKPAFLYGISYYSALGASYSSIKKDLADIKKYRFNWIRVWVNWVGTDTDISAVDDDGNAIPIYMNKLKWLVGQCNRRGIIVDVTLAHGNNKDSRSLKTTKAHTQAIKSVISALGGYYNWYIDLANEHDVDDSRFVSFDDLHILRTLCKELDPGLLVTASAGNDISYNDLKLYLQWVKVDFIAPHRPRKPASAAQTGAKTREYLEWMKMLGKVIPVHYQEPFRRGYTDWQPQVNDYITDLFGAVSAGAAGWCFHNGDQRSDSEHQPARSFNMRERRLFEQLDSVESSAIKTIAGRLKD